MMRGGRIVVESEKENQETKWKDEEAELGGGRRRSRSPEKAGDRGVKGTLGFRETTEGDHGERRKEKARLAHREGREE